MSFWEKLFGGRQSQKAIQPEPATPPQPTPAIQPKPVTTPQPTPAIQPKPATPPQPTSPQALQSICLTFDTKRIDTSSYGNEAWFTFWNAIREKDLGVGTRLYCGDLVSINPALYGILIESNNPAVITEIKQRLSSSEAYNKICRNRPFIEGTSAANARLVNAGTIDSRYILVGGESDWARVALSSVKLSELEKIYVRGARGTTEPRPRPASARTKQLQAITEMSALKERLKSHFPAEREFVSLLPEEVCDLADACSEHFYVAWELSGIVYTESFVKIYFMEKLASKGACISKDFLISQVLPMSTA